MRALHKGQRVQVQRLAPGGSRARAAARVAALALAQAARLLADAALHRALPLAGCAQSGVAGSGQV